MRIILLLVFFGNIFLVNAQKTERIRDSIFKYQFQNPNLAIEFGLEYFEDKLQYTYNFKLIYLLIMIGLSATIYLLIAKLLGVLKLESYKLK